MSFRVVVPFQSEPYRRVDHNTILLFYRKATPPQPSQPWVLLDPPVIIPDEGTELQIPQYPLQRYISTAVAPSEGGAVVWPQRVAIPFQLEPDVPRGLPSPQLLFSFRYPAPTVVEQPFWTWPKPPIPLPVPDEVVPPNVLKNAPLFFWRTTLVPPAQPKWIYSYPPPNFPRPIPDEVVPPPAIAQPMLFWWRTPSSPVIGPVLDPLPIPRHKRRPEDDVDTGGPIPTTRGRFQLPRTGETGEPLIGDEPSESVPLEAPGEINDGDDEEVMIEMFISFDAVAYESLRLMAIDLQQEIDEEGKH